MQITCPQCGKALEAPFPLPKMAQCPFCAAVFSPIPPPPRLEPAPTQAAPSPFTPPATPIAADRVSDVLRGPAIGLLITGILNIIWGIIDIAYRIIILINFQRGQGLPQLPPPFDVFGNIDERAVALGMVFDVVWMAAGLVVVCGAIRMQRFQSYSLAIGSSVLSMIPGVTCCCLLGFPFGIWAMIVLNRPDVRSSFR